MDASIITLVREVTQASDEERITFPEVLARLMGAGVERYHADLQRWEKTYYLPSGEAQTVPCHGERADAAALFSAEGVEAAVRASQRGEIGYREFCRRALAAGCVGYLVSLAGRRVVYHGRTGEAHVEHFPGTGR
jgi:uncharacterized protein YbcV (DUF1398 family)